MPIYEYRCNCGYQFEKLCRMNDTSVQLCPKCGGETRKVVSLFRTGRSSGSFGGDDYSSGGSSCSGCSSSSCAGCH